VPRKLALVLIAVVLTGSIASIFYAKRISAREIVFESGMLALQAGEFTRARDLLKRATELDGSNSQAFYELGNVYSALDETREAIEAWTEALRLEPTMHKAYFARGMQHYRDSDYPASLKDFERVVALHPSAESYLHRGLALQALGSHRAAIEDFDEALQRSSSWADEPIEMARAASQRALERTPRAVLE
jgi:tetratricopeptide (TPR) repeat protein